MPSLVPVLVDDASEDVEVELSGDGPLVDESAAEVSDPAGTVVISGWVMPPKLDAPLPPPQADKALVSVKVSGTRMDTMSLAKMSADVTSRWLQVKIRLLSADSACQPAS